MRKAIRLFPVYSIFVIVPSKGRNRSLLGHTVVMAEPMDGYNNMRKRSPTVIAPSNSILSLLGHTVVVVEPMDGYNNMRKRSPILIVPSNSILSLLRHTTITTIAEMPTRDYNNMKERSLIILKR
jgi:hypothetical protein